jgi:adenylate cyclase
LLAAFLLVSILPIGTLAVLSFVEERQVASETTESGEHAETSTEPTSPETTNPETAHELLGIPIAAIELTVAVVSLGLAVLMALLVGRRIVRPLRSLEGSMHAVEGGDLGAHASVHSNDEIGHLAQAFNRMVIGLRREALIRDLFGQYVTPEVARVAIEHEGRLEGEEIECSIVFADIRGFTALTEVMPAHRLLETLNRYLATMLREIASEGGIVNKFGGDSILAVFGSPLNPAPDHAARAVRSALRMRDALDAFNAEQIEAGLPELRAGFGVATGDVVAGNVGSERKIEYTVIGDAVNLAARLEELTRNLGEDILIAGATAKQVGTSVRLRPLGGTEIRGRAEPEEVFAADALIGSA